MRHHRIRMCLYHHHGMQIDQLCCNLWRWHKGRGGDMRRRREHNWQWPVLGHVRSGLWIHHCFWQQGWCTCITFQVLCENSTSLINKLVSHNCQFPESRVCGGLFSNREFARIVTWFAPSVVVYSPLIRNVFSRSADSNSIKNIQKKNRMATQYDDDCFYYCKK